MSEAAFDTSKCNIPFVPRIPRTPIITDCTIPTAPQAIPDCNSTALPITPPYPDPICTQMTLSTSVTSVPAGHAPQVTGSVVPVMSQDYCGEGCAFQMQLGFQFPKFPQVICTAIAADATITTLPVGESPQVTAEMIPVGTPQLCQFQLHLNFQLPQTQFQCTLVQIGEVQVGTLQSQTPQVHITSVPITDAHHSCGFQLNFSFGFPEFSTEKPCIPQFVQGLVQTQTTCAQDASTYQLSVRRVGHCEYRTDLFVQQPAAPGVLVAEIASPIDGEIGRYNVKVIYGTLDVGDTGDLVDTDFGTVPEAANAVMWYPPDIGSLAPSLIQGDVLVCKKTCEKVSDKPLLVGCGAGTIPKPTQVGQDLQCTAVDVYAWEMNFIGG